MSTSRVNFSNVIALVALFVSLGGGAYALKSNSVSSKEIKNSSVKSKDVKDHAIKAEDVKEETLTGTEIADGSIAGADVDDGSIAGADLFDGSVAGVDVANGSITGADVDESTLAGVPPSGSAGGDLSGGYPNPVLAQGVVGPAELATLPHGKALGSTQTVADGIVTKIALGGPATISGMTFDNADDSLTVVEPGLYAIVGFITWSPNATGRRVVQIHVSGNNLVEDSRDAVAAARTSQSITTLQDLGVGDQITLHGQQVSGGDLDTRPLGSPSPVLDAFWVGP